MARTMRIAYFSPLAPLRCDTSAYSEDLLPHLCRRGQVDAYTDDRVAAAQEIGRIYPLYGYGDFAGPERYDQLVYQLGDSPEHRPICDLFMRTGGVVVLHDLELTRVGADAVRPAGTWGSLVGMRRSEGLGPFLRTAGGAFLRGQRPQPYSLTHLVARHARGVIVHSPPARERLLAGHPQARVREVPPGVPRPPVIDAAEARRLLNLPADAFICVSVGRLGPEKRIHVAMQAFARLLSRHPSSLYLLVGEVAPGYPLPELARSLGIAANIRLSGYVDLATLYRHLAASDVGISLHDPGAAQVPGGLLRTMSMGRPTVVTNVEPCAQLPGDCVLKADVGVGETAQIAAALWALAAHPPMRQWYGQRAAAYVRANHALAVTARQYMKFLEELATVEAAENLLLGERIV